MAAISFSLTANHKGMWFVLSKNQYDDCLQPILELGDNAIAAKSSNVKIMIDFEVGLCSIEDDGIGFPVDVDQLSRCFTYSPDKLEQSDLNEHGCGLKSSLAILDPDDKYWSIAWKRDNIIYQIAAPYCGETINVHKLNKWPGVLTESHGTIIQFPIRKENFKALYTKKDAKISDPIPKLKEELSQYWMYHDRIRNETTKLFVNDEYLKPFVFDESNSDLLGVVKFVSDKLSSGADIRITHYPLKKHQPSQWDKNGGTWFKKTMTSNGVYMFKNGRLIQKVNGGVLYERLIGAAPHNSHNGTIIIVNVKSNDQTKLPITVPTKNKYKDSNNPLYHEMCDKISEFVIKNIELQKSDPTEESLVSKFVTSRKNTIKSIGLVGKLETEQEIRSENTELKSQKLDIYEVIGDTHRMYEAKRDNRVGVQDVFQTYGNWITAKDVLNSGKQEQIILLPIILINATSDYVIPEDIKLKIVSLKQNSISGFPLEIWNFQSECLWR